MLQAEEGVACPTKIIKPHHFKSPQHPVTYIIQTAREDEQLAGKLTWHVFPFKKINHTQKFFNHFTVLTVSSGSLHRILYLRDSSFSVSME